MNSKYEIINSISCDLKIKKYVKEDEEKFISRIIYSALGTWIKSVTLDKEILVENSDTVGVSKIHINNRCKPFLDSMIELFPITKKWFYPDEKSENPIKIITKRLLNVQQVVNAGFKTNIALPLYKECTMNNGTLLIRGMKKDNSIIATGLVCSPSCPRK